MYECHITVEKPTDRTPFELLATEHGWKTSCIDGDPVLGKKAFFYFTAHAKSYDHIFQKMSELARILGEKVVIRQKIEHIVYDTARLKKPSPQLQSRHEVGRFNSISRYITAPFIAMRQCPICNKSQALYSLTDVFGRPAGARWVGMVDCGHEEEESREALEKSK